MNREEIIKEAHLIADLYCPIQGEVNKSSNANLAGYIIGAVLDAYEAKNQQREIVFKEVFKNWQSLEIPNDLPKQIDRELSRFTVYLQQEVLSSIKGK